MVDDLAKVTIAGSFFSGLTMACLVLFIGEIVYYRPFMVLFFPVIPGFFEVVLIV
jgi:hypothetical protein